jgi:hypothetical protein
VGLTNLGSESETCVGSRVRLVGVFHLLREEFLSAPIHSPPLWFAVSVLQQLQSSGQSGWAPRLGSPGSGQPPPEQPSGTVASSPPVATAASSAASSIVSGASSAAFGTSGVKFCMGTAAGMSPPSASAPVNKKTSASATTTTLWEYYTLSRVLTFDHTSLGQCSSSSRRLGLRLRGRSGLLGGRRGFFLRHRRRGLIPLPGQIY